MKKRIFAIVAALMLMAAPAMAQIYMTEEDMNSARAETEFGVMVPTQAIDDDQWKITPVGEGIALLTVLAGAYLIGKRKKED